MSDIYVIWDLHWNLNAYYENLKSLSLIDDKWKWIWKNCICIFLWDILADRHTNWIDILLKIREIKKNAEKNNCQIQLISGNHDYKALLYLFTKSEYTSYKWTFKWLIEFKKFASDDFQNCNDFDKLRNDSKNIIYNMKNSDKWKNLIEIIKTYKLVYRSWSILFIHTNPTYEILNIILDKWIDYINGIFNKWVASLIHEEKPINNSLMKEFFYISNIFLLWNRRRNLPNYEKEYIYNNIYDIWIDTIINWHNWFGGLVDRFDKLKVIDIDYSFGKKIWEFENERSILKIINWEIFIWAEKYKISK